VSDADKPDPLAQHPPTLVEFAKALRVALRLNLAVGLITFTLGAVGVLSRLLGRNPAPAPARGMEWIALALTVVCTLFGLAQGAFAIVLDRRAARGAPVFRVHLLAMAAVAAVPALIAALPVVTLLGVMLTGRMPGFVGGVLCLSLLPLVVAGGTVLATLQAWWQAPTTDEP